MCSSFKGYLAKPLIKTLPPREGVGGEGGVLQQKGPSAGLGKQLTFNLGGTVSRPDRLCSLESTAP